MASVNIGGGNDQFNRYKMPQVMGKVEGRGNGIKTRIVNCVEVARALHRPPGYVCKFFGCELCAQTKISDAEGIYIVNGAFDQTVLAETLQKFIKMFVLCQKCALPETDLKIRKSGLINQVCNACGEETMCDMTHKLCTYIVNNPPDGKKKKVDGKKDKAARRAAKKKKGNGELEEDTEKAAKKLSKKSTKKVGEASEPTVDAGDIFFTADQFASTIDEQDDDEVQWSVDTSKEAQEERQRELGSAASILERAPVEDMWNRIRKLRGYIDGGKKASKVIAKAERIFGEEETIQGIVKAATVDESVLSVGQSVHERAIPVLKHLGTPMPTEAQEAFLDYFDWAATQDKKMKVSFPHILKHGYDDGILEEEVIIGWFNNVDTKEEVKDATRVIVDWLQNAEEDSDEEDEDEVDGNEE